MLTTFRNNEASSFSFLPLIRGLGWVGALSGILFLTACNGDGNLPDLEFDNAQQDAQTTVILRQIDPSALSVTVILPLSGERADVGRDLKNGLLLAAERFGNGKINFTFLDTTSDDPTANTIAERLKSEEPPDLTLIASREETLRSFDNRSILTIAVTPGDAIGSQIYPFALSDLDSLQSGVDYAENITPGPIILFAKSKTQEASTQISTLTSLQGNPIHLIEYLASEKDSAIIQRALQTGLDASVYAFQDTPQRATTLTEQLIRMNPRARGSFFIGPKSWRQQKTLPVKLQGFFVADLDDRDRPLFNRIYTQKYQLPASSVAAYGFDIMAVISNLLNSDQPALPEDQFLARLQDPTGFKGVSGSFRFLANGRLQRALAIHKIENGRFVPEKDPDPSF